MASTNPIAASAIDDSAAAKRSPRDPALDGLRGLAVLLIFVFHYGGGLRSHNPLVHLFGVITAAGWTGVTLFFALSGFLITSLLWNSIGQPNAYLSFYGRRIIRVFPLYFLSLLACAVAMIVTHKSVDDISTLYVFVFFLQDIPRLAQPANLVSYLPTYHLWSLAVEEQFYLIWPVLLAFFSRNLGGHSRRRALRFCYFAFAVSLIFCGCIFGLDRFFSEPFAQSFNVFFLTHSEALTLGGALAIVLHTPADSFWRYQLEQYVRPVFLASILAFIASSIINGSFTLAPRFQFVFGLPAVSLACVCAIALVLRPGLMRKIFSLTPLRFMGRISYGFYLFHVLLQPLFDAIAAHLTHTTTGNTYQFARFAAAFPITLVVAWLSFEFFESPLFRFKRYFPVPVAAPLG